MEVQPINHSNCVPLREKDEVEDKIDRCKEALDRIKVSGLIMLVS